MILSEDKADGTYLIKAYEPGLLTINEDKYSNSLIISKNKLITPWPVDTLAAINDSHWQAVLELKPDLVILGTGERFVMPAQKLLAPLYQAQIGVECMGSRAACRTYMALLAEGRNVVAAIILEKTSA